MARHRAAEKRQVETLIARLPDDIRTAAVEEGRGLRDRKAANGALAYIDRLLVDKEELQVALNAEKERTKAETLRADALKAGSEPSEPPNSMATTWMQPATTSFLRRVKPGMPRPMSSPIDAYSMKPAIRAMPNLTTQTISRPWLPSIMPMPF